MNKRKCRNRECNQFFRPPKTETYVKAFWCSPECKEAIALANLRKNQENRLKAQERAAKRAKKAADREHRERKKDLKPISHWLRETQKVVNAYRLLELADEPCISCGAWDVEEFHAGHFRSIGAASHLRFTLPDNLWKQCSKCNTHLSGNLAEHRPRLIAKIGLERVEALENENTPKSWTREELEELRKVYRSKIKALQAQ